MGRINRNGHAKRLVIATLVAVSGSSCTDAATRLGSDIAESAQRLATSTDDTLVFQHAPRANPSGCPSRYQVLIQPSETIPNVTGKMEVVCDERGRDERALATYDTTVHLREVSVPSALRVEKGPGSSLEITLTKRDGRILLSGIR